jgi:UDP-glucose 4-epimerase
MRVFVTGSSSCLARALLPKLCAVSTITRVTGYDLAPPRFVHAKFRALRGNVLDAGIEDALRDHAALIHLAFVLMRGRMSPQVIFETNVTGSMRVFHAARACGIRRLIHLSSAAVYGRGIHLAEDTSCRPQPGFLYAEHNALLEKMLAIEFPDCVRLRPHIILGPHAQPMLKTLLRRPFYLRLPRPHPLLQRIHENDVADAILRCLERDVHGAFNLAVEDALTYRELIRRRHRLAMPLPLTAARAGWKLASMLYGWGGDPAWLNGLSHSLTLNCRRALVELGWRRNYDLAAILKAE